MFHASPTRCLLTDDDIQAEFQLERQVDALAPPSRHKYNQILLETSLMLGKQLNRQYYNVKSPVIKV